ncbi:MAG TPA: hypothetical protein PLJ32_03655 [Kiritimatiellia bacterium]|jgi:hypothetical protein|nr:hypothetical protein [Kiritimatiellia bacterium]HOR96907.1 hypothetical protein [Kiritimatiellia bacterium]HPW75050.1 hypothetical protein [Kiritimatiellia bacterium]
MKRLFLFLFVLVLAVAGVVQAVETVAVPVLDSIPSLVDGMLTDDCWSKALTLAPFTPIQPNQKPLVQKTEAKLFVTKDAFYLGLIGYTEDAAFTHRQSTDVKAGPFGVDHFEIFVDPGHSGNLMQLAFGVNGCVYGNTSGRIRFGVQVYDDRYQIEVEIPFDIFPLKRQGFNSEWLFNVARDAKLAGVDVCAGEYSSWSQLVSGTFHEADSFNRLTGIGYNLAASFALQAAATKKPIELVAEKHLWMSDTVRIIAETNGKVPFVEISCAVSNSTGSVVWQGKVKATGTKAAIEIPLKGCADGRYRFEAKFVDASGRTLVETHGVDFWKIPPKKTVPRTIFTCRDNNIYKNGEFFFPIITWGGAPEWGVLRNHRFDTNAFFRCYHAILAEQKELGFNTILTGAEYYPDLARRALTDKTCRKYFPAWKDYRKIAQLPFDFNESIALHAEHNLAIIPYLHIDKPQNAEDVESWLGSVLKWREADNILCWHLSDELDGAIDHNRMLNELHHDVDPDRLTWINCIQGIAANRDNADILSTDPYPIPHSTVTMVGFHVKRLMDTCRPEQSPWLWLQMFGGEGNWTRSPTFAELKSMVYITLNRGVRGIAYFIYKPDLVDRDGIRSITQEDYDKLGPMNRRVARLAKMYCLGEVIERQADDRKLTDVAVIKYDRSFWVSVVNGNTAKQRVRVKLPVSLPQSGIADVDDENRTVSFQNSVIEEEFEPFAVHVYKIRHIAQ